LAATPRLPDRNLIAAAHPRNLSGAPAGPAAELDRYIGYWKPYATSHAELDADTAIQEEVRNAARTLLEAVQRQHEGKFVAAGENLTPPRQK
jgi:hypothetical protein